MVLSGEFDINCVKVTPRLIYIKYGILIKVLKKIIFEYDTNSFIIDTFDNIIFTSVSSNQISTTGLVQYLVTCLALSASRGQRVK